MTKIEQTYSIHAPVEKVWWALTTAEGAEAWGAGPAKMHPVANGEFSYWNGDIHGINTEVVPLVRLVQNWYGHDDPTKRYLATFEFTSPGSGKTDVHLTHEGEHDDIQKDIADWSDYYFKPIKQLLESS